MTVNVSKPAINVREKLAELDKPTGIAGEAMLRAETPQEQQALIGVGRRNLLINGGFDVWQRGTSGFTSNGIYTADRWKFNSTGSTIAVAKETANPELGNVLSASSDTTSTAVFQFIENGGQYLYNKHHTVSFWVKADNPCTASFRMRNQTTAVNYADFAYKVSAEWTKITHTFSPYTGFSPTDVARLYLVNNTSVATKIYFAQVQLELGKVATPFEHRSYGEELALCQRYYYRLSGDTGDDRSIGVGFASANNDADIYVQYPVELRDTPSTTIGADIDEASFKISTASAGTDSSLNSIINPTRQSVRLRFRADSGTPFTTGEGCVGQLDNVSSAYIEFDAEL